MNYLHAPDKRVLHVVYGSERDRTREKWRKLQYNNEAYKVHTYFVTQSTSP